MRTLFVLSLLAAGVLSADTLTLKDGRVMNGTFIGGTAREVRLDLGDHVETIAIDRIATLQFDSSSPVAQSGPPPSAPPPPPQANANPNFDRFNRQPPPANTPPPPNYNDAPPPQPAPPQPAPAAASAGIVIPQGTPLTVRMIDSVDSQTNRMGDTFRASIEDPVVVNEQTVIPRGADVTVRLVDDKQSGKIAGKTVLTLAVTSVNVDGRPIDVTTGDVQQASASRSGRSAKVIGGATVLGAIIGAAAGGGRGAAIGAGSGAAVGTGAEVATKGQRVKIPSETRLTFTLSNDVRL
ncbi:MAG TPA: hypothetical protein VGL72_13310 [Bryobacteraceae bacterium]